MRLQEKQKVFNFCGLLERFHLFWEHFDLYWS